MKCSNCGNEKMFTLRVFEWIWRECLIDATSMEADVISTENEIHDADGWDGIFCSECDDYIGDEERDWATIDKMWDAYEGAIK